MLDQLKESMNRPRVTKRFITLTAAFFGLVVFVCGIIWQYTEADRRGDAMAPKPAARKYIFRLKSVSFSAVDRSRHGVFDFEHWEAAPLKLPGFFGMPAHDGEFEVHFVDYEIESNGTWERLAVGYDGVPEIASIPPGTPMELDISLGPLDAQVQSWPKWSRVIIEGIMSEPFRLEEAGSK
jgi:hypothetical protein